MSDNQKNVWDKFFEARSSPLHERFKGQYRAIVVDTNDPLNMGRVRFKCPDMHDWTIDDRDCPWAVRSHDIGGKKAGSWANPCIGDWIWIDFERGHPYGPVFVGFATPTRRRQYPLASIHQKTPVSLNIDGEPDSAPNDYDDNYLPVDGRPMSVGMCDRYGNLDLASSVGFFPVEHAKPPVPPGFDSLINTEFIRDKDEPAVNEPDCKFMARVTKYGTMFVLGDQGYAWKADGDVGEFTGDVTADEDFEVERWKYLQRLISEDDPVGDKRRAILSTRYGHKIEARDVGWAQPGPMPSKSRVDEYGRPSYLSKETIADERWVKIRTKGGWVLQAYDKGFDPQEDEFIKRPLIDEVGSLSEREDLYWADRDARWFRIIGRHGFKIVIDERGTDSRSADSIESPRGNGILLKGRRTGGCLKDGAIVGDPRGFYFEFNENDAANHTTWGSPLGQAIEMNDATEYMALAVGVGRDYAMPFRGLEENEFLRESVRARDPESRSHHLIMDHQNEYIRFKTRSGGGDPAKDEINPSGLTVGSINQGIEARDGLNGDGPWVEVVDSEGRGLWMSRSNGLSILRSKNDKKLYLWLDDAADQVVLYAGESSGKIQIFSANDVEVIAANELTLRGRNVNIKADEKIRLEAGGNPLTLQDDRLSTGGDVYGGTAHMRMAGVPSLDDVTAIATAEASRQASDLTSALSSAIEVALGDVQVDGTVDDSGQVSGSLQGLAIDFSPSPANVQPPTMPTGSGSSEPGGDPVDDPDIVMLPSFVQPTDRGRTYNVPSVVDDDEVVHPI